MKVRLRRENEANNWNGLRHINMSEWMTVQKKRSNLLMQQNGKEASMRQNVFQIHSEKLFVREWGTSTELSTL